MPIARLNQRDDWVHVETTEVVDNATAVHTITPESGEVSISYVDQLGNERYWNGSAYVAGSPIILATTIVGTKSTYPYTHQDETRNRQVIFEGRIERNGYYTPLRRVEVFVLPVEHEGYYVD